MTATYTFDVFSSLDGYGAAGGDWTGYWGKQGPELLDHRLAQYSEEQRMVFGANTYRAFAPGEQPHTFTNRGSVPARFLIVCIPGGFEREFARRAARPQGAEPLEWALQEIPPVTRVGPRFGEAS